MDEPFSLEGDSRTVCCGGNAELGSRVDGSGQGQCEITTGARGGVPNSRIADPYRWIGAELEPANNAVATGDGNNSLIDWSGAVRIEPEDTVERTSFEPKVVNTTRDSITITIE